MLRGGNVLLGGEQGHNAPGVERTQGTLRDGPKEAARAHCSEQHGCWKASGLSSEGNSKLLRRFKQSLDIN